MVSGESYGKLVAHLVSEGYEEFVALAYHPLVLHVRVSRMLNIFRRSLVYTSTRPAKRNAAAAVTERRRRHHAPIRAWLVSMKWIAHQRTIRYCQDLTGSERSRASFGAQSVWLRSHECDPQQCDARHSTSTSSLGSFASATTPQTPARRTPPSSLSDSLA